MPRLPHSHSQELLAVDQVPTSVTLQVTCSGPVGWNPGRHVVLQVSPSAVPVQFQPVEYGSCGSGVAGHSVVERGMRVWLSKAGQGRGYTNRHTSTGRQQIWERQRLL